MHANYINRLTHTSKFSHMLLDVSLTFISQPEWQPEKIGGSQCHLPA